MYFELTEEQKKMKDLARNFAKKRIKPTQEVDEKEGIFRKELVQEMGELGFFGGLIPENFGGTNVGFLSSIIMQEEIARVSASYGGHFISQMAGPPTAILKFGAKEQKERYIPALIKGDLIICFAVTEPDAGSDVASMRMTGIKKGDFYILDGLKSWISNAPVADVGLIFAYTDKSKRHNGISSFIVEIRKTSGISTKKIEKLGLNCSTIGEIVFEQVEINEDCLLGKEGDGFNILMGMLGNTRLFAAGRALGLGRACLEESIKYAKEREQFGEPICKFQMIQNQLAEMSIEHEASKMLVYHAALNKDKGINDLVEVAIAKYFACKSATKAADTAMEIFSSYGFSMEYPIQRYVRDSRAFNVTEGTSNIQKIIIARKLIS
jgi:glutaryl-CoA dehydrogenase (non-decarboxylating)